MIVYKFQPILTALLICSIVAGCGSEREASGAQVSGAGRAEGKLIATPNPVVIAEPESPYRVISVSNGGTVTGIVQVDSTVVLPSDTVYQPNDPRYCGASISEKRAAVSAGKLSDAIVWLANIRSGKSLPAARRFELLTAKCSYEPRTQVIMTDGTLNVINEDALVHTVRLINDATGELLASAPFNDNGEVVPFDMLLKSPKLLAVRSNVYPWAKAWVAVLDHPYFAVTGKDGSFSIPDVPAGTYEMKAYHPVLGMTTDTITVGSGQTANVAFTLPTKPQG